MDTSVVMSVVYGALLVEAVVNIVQNIKDAANSDEPISWKYWAAFILSLVVGVVVAVNFELDLFKMGGLEGRFPVVGSALTGVIISRGSNVISDLIGRLNAWKA